MHAKQSKAVNNIRSIYIDRVNSIPRRKINEYKYINELQSLRTLETESMSKHFMNVLQIIIFKCQHFQQPAARLTFFYSFCFRYRLSKAIIFRDDIISFAWPYRCNQREIRVEWIKQRISVLHYISIYDIVQCFCHSWLTHTAGRHLMRAFYRFSSYAAVIPIFTMYIILCTQKCRRFRWKQAWLFGVGFIRNNFCRLMSTTRNTYRMSIETCTSFLNSLCFVLMHF